MRLRRGWLPLRPLTARAPSSLPAKRALRHKLTQIGREHSAVVLGRFSQQTKPGFKAFSMQRLVQTVLGAIASGVVVISCVFAAAWSEEALPRSAEQLTLPQLRSHLSSERVDVLVGRWMAEINPADVEGPSRRSNCLAARRKRSSILRSRGSEDREPSKRSSQQETRHRGTSYGTPSS